MDSLKNKENKIDEKIKKDADIYPFLTFSERMKLAVRYLEDEEKLKSFLNFLEEAVFAKFQTRNNNSRETINKFLEKILEARRFLETKTAYKKIILEYLSLTAPIIPQ